MSNDWLGRNRTEQLETARNWLTIFNQYTRDAEGREVKKSTAWNIPLPVVAALEEKVNAAEAALSLAVNADTRTKVVDQQVKTAFEALVADERMIKRRFGHIPPMTEADYVAMGWRVPDKIATPIGPSKAVPTGLLSYPRPHVVRFRVIPVDGAVFDRRSASLVCVRYGILDSAKKGRLYIKKIPVSADELPEQEERRRRDEEFTFTAEDAGKKAYFCMRYVNSKGEAGGWGPIIEAVIT